MDPKRTFPNAREETPVDDVRRVRVRLSREAGGDVRRLIEASRKVAEEYRERLGLKPVTLHEIRKKKDEGPRP